MIALISYHDNEYTSYNSKHCCSYIVFTQNILNVAKYYTLIKTLTYETSLRVGLYQTNLLVNVFAMLLGMQEPSSSGPYSCLPSWDGIGIKNNNKKEI